MCFLALLYSTEWENWGCLFKMTACKTPKQHEACLYFKAHIDSIVSPIYYQYVLDRRDRFWVWCDLMCSITWKFQVNYSNEKRMVTPLKQCLQYTKGQKRRFSSVNSNYRIRKPQHKGRGLPLVSPLLDLLNVCPFKLNSAMFILTSLFMEAFLG